MKNRNFKKHLAKHNCELGKEKGGRVKITNLTTGKKSIGHLSHPKGIPQGTADAICKQLGIPKPDNYQ